MLGVLLGLKHQIPAILAAGGGSIVNNASVAGTIGMPTMGVYVASKHAVIGLTKVAALEYSKRGVRVNSVSPGAVVTEMYERFTGGTETQFAMQMAALHPIGRVGEAREIAEPVVFLLSEASSFLTGQDIPIDGGFTAQ